MKNKNFNDKCEGQVLSLDLMLGFVLLTVIIGISADAMDIASYKMQDYSSRTSIDRLAVDAADILIKSSGSPQNWEKCGCDPDTIPGLAKIDIQTRKTIPNTISMAKVNKLKENYNNLIYGRILPLGVNSSMMIYPSNDSFAPIPITNNKPPANPCDIAIANRTVLLYFMHSKIVIYNNTDEGNASTEQCANPGHRLDNSSYNKTKCSCFNVTLDELNSSDFYLITDGNVSKSGGWIIDRADEQNNTLNQFSSAPVLINDEIGGFRENSTKSVLWLHVITGGGINCNYDCYIVCVPKGTPPDMVNIKYLNTGPWFFILRVWR